MFKKYFKIFLFLFIINIFSFGFCDEIKSNLTNEEIQKIESYNEVEPIPAGIKYNEVTARIAAFNSIERKIKKDVYRDYLRDPNRKENLEYIKNKQLTVEDKRELCPFYSSGVLVAYSVTYFDNPQYSFYYNTLGILFKFDKDIYETDAVKTYGYSRYGNLISVSFTVNDNSEQFVYRPSGKLAAHWLGNEIVNKSALLKLLDLTRGN